MNIFLGVLIFVAGYIFGMWRAGRIVKKQLDSVFEAGHRLDAAAHRVAAAAGKGGAA